ncbi:hypothetical protein [Peribacillus butanolivorans]|uniref:hypothetical protein n=1 Tax=Peribacillus butanolivorans TaxID=421767 RepID=UPI0036672763
MSELLGVEKFRAVLRDEDYRFFVAKVAVFLLKDKVRNKTELYKSVNKILLSQQLNPISFNFIRTNI